MVQFNGHFDGKVITPDECVNLPLNRSLRIIVETTERDDDGQPVDWERLLHLAEQCAVEGPQDLAERHDHYAHGKPAE